MTEPDLSGPEFEALRRLVREDLAGDLPVAAADALEARGLVRREGQGWVVTVAGHARYLAVSLADF